MNDKNEEYYLFGTFVISNCITKKIIDYHIKGSIK